MKSNQDKSFPFTSSVPFVSNGRTLSKPFIKSSINNFHATTSPSLSHACSSIDPSMRTRQGTLDSQRERERERERERREREFLDPFSIVTRLMGEGSSVRVFEPVISPTLDSAGKTRPAAGRGTNERTKEGRNGDRPSPRVQATCIIRQIWSRQNGLKKRGRKAESQKTWKDWLSHTPLYLDI